jgi:hypothetical protein
MRRHPLPRLYSIPREQLKFKEEPWAGQGVEEFATPWMVYERGWGDCDDYVIWRCAELITQGIECNPVIVHNTETDKYHTLVRVRDRYEDPSLQRLGRPYQCPPHWSSLRYLLAAHT